MVVLVRRSEVFGAFYQLGPRSGRRLVRWTGIEVFELLHEVAFAVAFHLRGVTVLTEQAGDVVFVHGVAQLGTGRPEQAQDIQQDQEYGTCPVQHGLFAVCLQIKN